MAFISADQLMARQFSNRLHPNVIEVLPPILSANANAITTTPLPMRASRPNFRSNSNGFQPASSLFRPLSALLSLHDSAASSVSTQTEVVSASKATKTTKKSLPYGRL